MTLPNERARSVIYAQQFLRDLLDPKLTPRVPGTIRKRALAILRHYPWVTEIEQTAKKCPSLWEVPK